MKEKIVNILKPIVFGIGIAVISTLIFFGIFYIINYDKHEKYQVYEEMTRLQYESVKLELVNEIDSHIKSVAKNSCLNGVIIVDKCEKYSIDICFVLAQAKIESVYGTTGIARKTNSVWNVFAYDNHKYEEILDKGKFHSPDNSIEPYIKLLRKQYLVDGKTEYDMLQSFVDKNGNRYATDEDYERKLTSAFTDIKTNTKIDSLSLEMKRYAIILGY